MPKIRFKDGLKTNLPTLDVAEPAFTTDTEEFFIGSANGNIQLVKQEDLTNFLDELANVNANAEVMEARGTYPVLGDRIEHMDNSVGDLSILPSWLQESLAFALNAFYNSMTEINVRTPPYNLKGDGTDETAAIQTLFNLARDNGQVYLKFPKGTYAISNYIQFYKNTFVKLNDDAVIQRIGTYYKMFANGDLSNKSYAGGGYTGEGNIHLTGGTFDLNSQAVDASGVKILPDSQTVTFFDLGHAENISFDNITVKNGQIGHYFQVSSCKNVRFNGCWFGGITYAGDGVNFDYECLQIEVATSDSFPDFGNYDLTISRDIYIEDCTFDGVVRGVGTHSDGKYGTANTIFCENIQIRGCIFRNVVDNALNLTGYRYSTFENNLIDTVTGYGINLNVSEDNRFTGNKILNTQKSAHNLVNSHNNKFNKNVLKEVCLSTTSSYSANRLTTSNNNSFDDDTVAAITPNYSYAWYSSGGCTGNKITNHKYAKGKSGTIGGDFSMSANLNWVSVGDSITLGNISGNGHYQDHAMPLMPKVTTSYNRGYSGYCAYIPPTITTGSITAGSTSLTVADATQFAVGGHTNIVGGGLNGANFHSTITAINGNVITIQDVAPATVSNLPVRKTWDDSISDVSIAFETADIYTIELGTNDFSNNVPIGSYSDAQGATNSLWGGLKQLYSDLTTKNMNAVIVVITPMKRTKTPAWDSANTLGLYLLDYVNAIKDFAGKYGCPVLDLFNDSGISNKTAPTLLSDGLHPTIDTNKRLGKMIANKINLYI